MKNNRIQWGVIGSGGIARRRTIPEGILPSRNGDLVAIYDIQPEINHATARQFGVHPASGLDELLAMDIDAVYIATPANVHYQQVLASAKAGKHILCEKPLGLTADEAKGMLQVCKEHNITLGTALMMRFHSQHQAALQWIQEGKLGKPVYGRAQLSCWYPPMPQAWRQQPQEGGGGSLIDMGGHCIDLLEMFFGPVSRVSCFIRNRIHDYPSEDSAAVMLDFENGAMATVDTFFCIPDKSSKNRLELYGSQGSLLAQGTIGQGEAGEMLAIVQENRTGYNAQQERNAAGGIMVSPLPVNMYRAEIEEFEHAILEQRMPLNHAGLGLRNQAIIAACYESARTGQTVTV